MPGPAEARPPASERGVAAAPPVSLATDETELPAGLAQMDRALIGLRHLWRTPPQVQDPALGRIDMSTVWIVDALAQAQGELTIRDLAVVLDVAHSTASRLVDRAEACGAIVRARARTDARMVAVRLTGPGQELARTSRAFRGRHLHRATAGWTDAERSTFADLLTRFADSVDTLDTTL